MNNRKIVMVDRGGEFYPPSLGAALRESAGLGGNAWIIVHPASEPESLWAMEQVLRCRAVGAMLGWVDGLSDRAARRLQLAAERGCGVGMLIRPSRDERSPFWADARLRVDAVPTAGNRQLRVSLLRCRGGEAAGSVELRIDDDDQTCGVRVVSQMAGAAQGYRAAGA